MTNLNILHIELTNKCNLNCKHCFNEKNKALELTPKKVYEIIKDSKELGVKKIVFCGGEPLLVKNLEKYVNFAKSLEIKKIDLLTNGLLINENNLDLIKKFSLVQLSIDIPHKRSIRPRYFNKLKKTIYLLKKNKILVVGKVTLYASLIEHLEKLDKFSIDNDLIISTNRLIPIGNAKYIKDQILGPIELKKAFMKLSKLKKINNLWIISDPQFLLINKSMSDNNLILKKEIRGGCACGFNILNITPEGDVFPCPFTRFAISNIYKEKLKKIWKDNKYLIKLRNRELNGKCNKCKYKWVCGGCRGNSFAMTGDLFGSDPVCIKNLC